MALRDEQADILGGPILQRPESGLFAALSQYHFVFKSVTLFGFCLLVWIGCARGFEHLKKHRELRYRKAMRRKHGIPDSDCRPFAVAYAAAKRARFEREAQDRKKLTNMSDHNFPDVDQRTNAQKDTRALRRRVPETTVQLHDYQLPEKHAAIFENKRPEVQSLDFVDRYNLNVRRRVAIPESPVAKPAVRRASRKDLVINFDDNEESRKRTFEDESDVEHDIVKKSRIEGDELMDGGEHADWYTQYSNALPRHAPKESQDQQAKDDDVHLDDQVNDLRDEDHERIDETMQDVDVDEVTELNAMVRGRKRDRAEAGSTFGGDDDEDIKNGKASHLRKRRTIFRRGVETSTRGQKRDREAQSPESEGEGGDSETPRKRVQRSSKKKRGKKAASDEASEVSTEDPRVSKDPLCSGRRVGDEWEADGVHYKVGDKGERLRLTLVKKARNKYHMPQDSQHPDRSAALEIYVETWMREEQYKQAEGRQELAWQEVPNESNESKTPAVLDSPTKNGKNLLWDSVRGCPTRRPFRQFMHSSSSIRVNPFEQWSAQPALGRRVASSSTAISPILPGVVDSPTRPGFRGFSKWEKQDREAEAMARIRAKMEEQKKAPELPKKSAELSTSVITPELGIKPLSIPTITLTPAPTVAATEQSDSSRQSKPSTFSFATPSSTTSGLPLSSTAVPAGTLFPGASVAPSTTSFTASPPFSSTKPPPVPSSTSTTTPSSAIPNFFARMSGSSAPSVTSPIASSATTHPQPPSTEGPFKSTPFSFAKPDPSSFPSSTTATPATTKLQAPIFGTSTNSPPLPITFGSTPMVSKAEPAAPPVSNSTTTSESSKPASPLFSFSGASSPAPTPAPSGQSIQSLPKFSFGQPSTTSTFAASSNLAPGSASQPKLTFKFGQTPPGATDSASMSTVPASVADELKRPPMVVPAFGASAGLNESAKPSPFGSISNSPSPSATKLFGKSTTVERDASISMQPKPNTTFNSFSPQPTGAPVSGNIPVFSFSGIKSGSNSEAFKSAPSFGGVVGGSNPPTFSGSSSEGKPAFSFSSSTEGSKSTSGGNKESSKTSSVFGGLAEGPKSTFAFGGSTQTAKPTSAFQGVAEGPKLTFTFDGASEKDSTVADIPKPTSNTGNTTFGPSLSTSPFGKEEVTANMSDSANTQTKPATSFAFGAPSTMTSSILGQTSPFATRADPSHAIFGKPTEAKPSSFGFGGTGGSSSSSTFTFGKSAAQNQNQEQ